MINLSSYVSVSCVTCAGIALVLYSQLQSLTEWLKCERPNFNSGPTNNGKPQKWDKIDVFLSQSEAVTIRRRFLITFVLFCVFSRCSVFEPRETVGQNLSRYSPSAECYHIFNQQICESDVFYHAHLAGFTAFAALILVCVLSRSFHLTIPQKRDPHDPSVFDPSCLQITIMALFCYGHLLLTDFGVLPTYNIQSAGGSSTTGNRALFPIQYVHWSCNLPIMISTFATLECLPRELVLRHVFLSTSMSCAGILALLVPRELLPIPLTYSFYALGKITVDHYRRSTEVSSHDADLKARSQFQVSTILFWWLFPLVYTLSFFDMISVSTEVLAYSFLDVFTKSMHIVSSIRVSTLSWKVASQVLHQEQELHVREEAQRIYVAYVFHEVRNPLNGITGFLDSLNWELKDTLTSRSSVSSDLEAMGHCVHLMRQLLDNSLDLAKLEEGKLALKETPDDLVSFLYQTSNMISRVKTSSSANGILPITEIVMQDPRGNLVPPSALPVYFDRCRLSQILINLLSNALRHTQHGFVKLRVVVSPADSKADVLVNFEVQDTGCGIPENAQQALFQKYMCAQTGFDKTGLGLLLAKKLVSLMSGQITVQSPWQQGTTGCCFSFVLKMRRAAPPSLRKMVAQETTPSITVSENLLATHGKRWRVLNADDQQFNRVLMRRKLQSISSSMNLEWEIEDMETGEEVLACMKRNPAAYDVILLDEHFDNAGGVLKGTDVIAELKRSGIARLPVFISCSGNCTQSDMERYEGCGADIVFGKPTPTPARIAMDISRVLAKRLELFGLDRQETAVGTTHQVSRTGVLT